MGVYIQVQTVLLAFDYGVLEEVVLLDANGAVLGGIADTLPPFWRLGVLESSRLITFLVSKGVVWKKNNE